MLFGYNQLYTVGKKYLVIDIVTFEAVPLSGQLKQAHLKHLKRQCISTHFSSLTKHKALLKNKHSALDVEATKGMGWGMAPGEVQSSPPPAPSNYTRRSVTMAHKEKEERESEREKEKEEE